MRYDPVADALSRIRNAERSGHATCEVRPAGKLLASILEVMQEAGYIGPFEFIDDKRSGAFSVQLLGNVNNCGVIKPRYSVSTREFERWEARYLPAQDFGQLILTTTAGVVSHTTAKEMRIGGRLLAYVY